MTIPRKPEIKKKLQQNQRRTNKRHHFSVATDIKIVIQKNNYIEKIKQL
jgi:hypothetical protein